MQDESKYKVIATKVSPEAYRLLNVLAARKGMRLYELLQLCADVLVRYMSDSHNLTPEMEQAMTLFEHMTGWRDALSLTDYTCEPHVVEAVYYLAAEGKHGTRAVHVSRPYFGDWQQTENIQAIVERTLELATPERYRKLRLIAADMDCSSILELLDVLADRYGIDDTNTREIRRGFEDCMRAENNRPVEYGTRTKRKKNHPLDHSSEPHLIHFDRNDELPEPIDND